jgi:lactate dehydrogenase-like 2-hydroxyacid dehydrogenase
MAKPELLMLAEMMHVEPELESLFSVHKLWKAPASDKERLVAEVAPRIAAIASFNPAFSPTTVPAAMIEAMPMLRIVGHMGVGYDSVDTAAAAKRGIVVTNTPDVLTEEVADTALGLLLMTIRELSKAEQWLRSGKWARAEYPFSPTSLRGRKVGLVGMGRIGQAIARRIEALGLPVSYHARTANAGIPNKHYPDLVALARDVDTLIAILPGGAATKHIVDARVLEALGTDGVFINMARGSVVDEQALLEALHARKIAAAGLDVFQNEPHFNPAFLDAPNTVLLPHVGSSTILTRRAMAQLAVDNIKCWLEGKPPLTPVPETPFKGW